MNRETFLRKLAEALQQFVLHSLLLTDILGELRRSGREGSFLRILLARLKWLEETGRQAVAHKEFERLDEEIYSMHLSSEGFNMRILYGFLWDGRPALLLAFYERAGKQVTDYTGKTDEARARLREIEESL